MSSRVIAPGRSSTGAPRERSTMVDSSPTSHGPPSRKRPARRIHRARAPRSSGSRGRSGWPTARRWRRCRSSRIRAAAPAPWDETGSAVPTVSCPPVTALSGTAGALFFDHGERPRPRNSRRARNAASATARFPSREAPRHVGRVHDQRMVGGTALQREDLRDRGFVRRIGAEAVDGLRRSRPAAHLHADSRAPSSTGGSRHNAGFRSEGWICGRRKARTPALALPPAHRLHRGVRAGCEIRPPRE